VDPNALAGLCAIMARSPELPSAPKDPVCVQAIRAKGRDKAALRTELAAPGARDAIARVAYAEAANQGVSGLAAVVCTIVNRLKDGRWGEGVDGVLNAHAQFEPVLRAGGDWRRLPPAPIRVQAEIDAILNLSLDGWLEDLTHGARFFQNPVLVEERVRKKEAQRLLINFGGARPSAVIGDHSFYREAGQGLNPPGQLLRGLKARSEASARPSLSVFFSRAVPGPAPYQARFDKKSDAAAAGPKALFFGTWAKAPGDPR